MGRTFLGCRCRTCREFDWHRWCWKYVPVRYGRPQRLQTILTWQEWGWVDS